MVKVKLRLFDPTVGRMTDFTLVGRRGDKYVYQSELTGFQFLIPVEEVE